LVNHYEILGLKTSAGHAEIKTAFRRLAKQYHPDRNSAGKEHFEKILLAYETLSDPVLKSTYDYKLNYHLGQPQPSVTARQSAGTKTWSFDEKELKRRQYFNEHYKKNNKSTEQYNAEVETHKTYNEYKYILFATPIAVGLFVLMMKLAMPAAPKLVKPAAPVQEQAVKHPEIKMGDMPYTAYFGGAHYDPKGRELTVKNATGSEVIVCLFTKSAFVRSFYIGKDYEAHVSQLPNAPLFMRYFSGTDFRFNAALKDSTISGAFAGNRQYFKMTPAIQKNSDTIMLSSANGKQFTRIDESAFFKRINTHDKKN